MTLTPLLPLPRRAAYANVTVRNLGDGSLLGWTLAGQALVSPDGKAADTVHTFMSGLGGLAADGLKTTAFGDDDAAARLKAANERIAATLGL